MTTRLRRVGLVAVAGLELLGSGSRRALFREMRDFSTRLPAMLERPLPDVMHELDASSNRSGGPSAGDELGEDEVRTLADTAALLDRRSPLGLCLRRSLTRYHFLRRAAVPVTINFGARLRSEGTADAVLSGHAWLTLGGQPYFEDDEGWRDFVVVLSWPAVSRVDTTACG